MLLHFGGTVVDPEALLLLSASVASLDARAIAALLVLVLLLVLLLLRLPARKKMFWIRRKRSIFY